MGHVPTAVGGTADGTGRSTETPRTWVKVLGLVEPWPRPLPGMPPPAPLAMGWPTVAVKYRYSSNATVLTENEDSRTVPT